MTSGGATETFRVQNRMIKINGKWLTDKTLKWLRKSVKKYLKKNFRNGITTTEKKKILKKTRKDPEFRGRIFNENKAPEELHPATYPNAIKFFVKTV